MEAFLGSRPLYSSIFLRPSLYSITAVVDWRLASSSGGCATLTSTLDKTRASRTRLFYLPIGHASSC
jgi:hypothetical protein